MTGARSLLQAEAAECREHLFPDGGARELMAGLPGEAVRSLLHILECPSCQDATLGDLADALEARAGDPPADPVLLEEAEGLMADLLDTPAKNREQLVLQDRRFHRLDLLDLILETGEAAQARDLPKTTKHAALAVWMGSLVKPDAK